MPCRCPGPRSTFIVWGKPGSRTQYLKRDAKRQRPTSHRHPGAAERPRLVVGRMIKSARPSKDDRPGPSPFEAPPAEEAGVAPQDDGSEFVRANVGTIHRASGSGLS